MPKRREPGAAVFEGGYWRCHSCKKAHARTLTPPYDFDCQRCEVRNVEGIAG